MATGRPGLKRVLFYLFIGNNEVVPCVAACMQLLVSIAFVVFFIIVILNCR